jgi:vacuolar-type H+-ATPase subunit I/STV1
LGVLIFSLKIARNPELEQKMYQGAANRTELESLLQELQMDLQSARPGSEQYTMIQEQIGMVQEQLEAEDTITILNSYIDEVDTTVDKEKIKKVMRELYVEANIVE